MNPTAKPGLAPWVWRLMAWLWAIQVFIASVIPVGPNLGANNLDKVFHLCQYLLFAAILVPALTPPEAPRRMRLRAFAWATLYGIFIELVQLLVPWRSGDWKDGLSNALGAAIGVSLWRRMQRKPSLTP